MPHQGGYASQPQPQPQNVYAPQDFPPPPAGAPQAQQAYFDPYAAGQNPYAPRGRGDENVSATNSSAPPYQHATAHDNGTLVIWLLLVCFIVSRMLT